MTPRLPALLTLTAVFAGLTGGGCTSPLARSEEQELREMLLASHRLHGQALADSRTTPLRVTRADSITEQDLTPERRNELDKTSGPEAYKTDVPQLGPDLTGKTEGKVVAMTLQEAVSRAVRKNLDVQLANLGPAFNDTQITQAEALFDAVYFADYSFQQLDTPQPPLFGNDRQRETHGIATGIRKPMTTGGQFTIQTDLARNAIDTKGLGGDTFNSADVLLSLTQPLLRNFGEEVNRAQIELSHNAKAQSIQDVRTRMTDVALQTEAAYWQLVFARQKLLILYRLQQRAEKDRDQIKKRLDYDAQPVQLTEANSFVELRRAEVIRSRQDVRLLSDTLKRLINSDDLPLSGETVIEPLDNPADLAVNLQLSLLDAVSAALRHRPEVQRALLEIKDGAIRQRVADNQRLPQLNLAATLRYNSSSDNTASALGRITDGDYIDYLLGAQFETPIGNRAPEAAYRQRQIEHRALTIAYQRAAQQAVQEVKDGTCRRRTS
jgi:outer membrane protein